METFFPRFEDQLWVDNLFLEDFLVSLNAIYFQASVYGMEPFVVDFVAGVEF